MMSIKPLKGKHLSFRSTNKDSKTQVTKEWDVKKIRENWPLGKTEFEKWLDRKEQDEQI